MDAVRDLIEKRLKTVRLSMSQASLRIGRNASYLQQFLRRGIPDELHEPERIKLAELLGVSEDVLRGKSSRLIARPYSKNSNDAQMQISPDIAVTSTGQKVLDMPRIYPITNDAPDLPVFATTQIAGVSVMITKPFDRIARPNFLLHVVDAYALIISDDTMDPEAKNGSTALVHPHLPPRNGDTCLFRAERDTTSDNAMVRQLVSANDRAWRVHQHKPAKDYDLKKSEWPVCHLVVGNFSRR